ncbi:putative nucleotide-binding alpha-beta plait domain-containing protein [Medicago truncatula]|uniref:Putative nucleotide-binding alpha-beta plait domain-containing protein n=1 Tax=Medicago truncatula TaxID=3880 RepID=A0A072UPH6_MEDTR|nr:RNA recognition motif [Medicago truncatula]RHN63425.1 putative nucleotide-binding alpha-beta plait domain-containing protein [Medicago truncatula]
MFGCVTMSTVEEVEKAMKKFNGYELAGNFLTVSKDDIRNTLPDLPKRPHAFDSPFSVYVTKLSRSIENNEHLEQLFSKHGKVECAELICDKVSSRSRGYGFVTM